MALKWGEAISCHGWTRYLGRLYRRLENGGFATCVPSAYYDNLLALLGMLRCKSVVLPAGQVSALQEDGSAELNACLTKAFRTTVGKALWLLPVRPDLNFAVKEVARHLQKPTVADWARLKRIARYIAGTKDTILLLQLRHNALRNELKATVDASWASAPGCRSTSGGVLQLAGFLLNHWSRTQTTTAQSSAEAELLGLNLGGVEAMAVSHICEEIQHKVQIVLESDSSAALAMISRRGPGRAKHIEIRKLWLQDQISQGTMKAEKIAGESNVADILTKIPAARTFRVMCHNLGLRFGDEAQMVATIEQDFDDEMDESEEVTFVRWFVAASFSLWGLVAMVLIWLAWRSCASLRWCVQCKKLVAGQYCFCCCFRKQWLKQCPTCGVWLCSTCGSEHTCTKRSAGSSRRS
jgi:hypothetical protein